MGPGGEGRVALDIEMTEGVLMEKSDEVIQKLNGIRQMGVRVAIDDFGRVSLRCATLRTSSPKLARNLWHYELGECIKGGRF